MQSPPWNFVEYSNDTAFCSDSDSFLCDSALANATEQMPFECCKVTGGRDHHLLRLLSHKMNFEYRYVDPPQRTQGSISMAADNLTFSGALGMVQRRVSERLPHTGP